MNPGDKILVISVDSSDGRDAAASELTGVEARVERVTDDGDIYLEGYSWPVISGRDVYTITEVG
jgi:hypothetical protein